MANKTYDLDGVIVSGQAVTTTASCTPVSIVGLNVGSNDYMAVFNTGAVTGTVDGSNYYSLQLEVSDLVGGTYHSVGNAVVLPATATQFQVGFTSEQINKMVAGANFFRVNAVKTGTTATAMSYSAFLSAI